MGLAIKGKKVIGLALNGKKILGEAKNGKVIWRFFAAVGQSLYDGIPSKGIMLYGTATGYSSSNPLGIQGDSINLKAPLSSCPNGIKIQFSNIIYDGNGGIVGQGGIPISIPDISIPKGSSSGLSSVITGVYSSLHNASIIASINGSTLSFSINNQEMGVYNREGTVTYYGNWLELLAITSITAY